MIPSSLNSADSADGARFPRKIRALSPAEQVCLKTGWQVLAYCLLPNHFHSNL